MVQKASGKLTDLLNKAIARELKVSVQYMWHHVMARGLESAEIAETFEKIAERLWYFDATPTTKPDAIDVGGDVKHMLEVDAKAEVEAIDLYKAIIAQAESEGDTTTRLMFEQILAEEEDHHNTFTTLLGQ